MSNPMSNFNPLGSVVKAIIFIVCLAALLNLAGCSAPQTREHREILKHQAEGQLVYREANGVKYYVECEYGLKYLSSTASNERIGPIDTCTGEEE